MYVLFGVFPIKHEFSKSFDISLVPRGHLVYMKIYISSITSRFSGKRARTTLFFSLSLGRNRQTPDRAVEIEPPSHVVTKGS